MCVGEAGEKRKDSIMPHCLNWCALWNWFVVDIGCLDVSGPPGSRFLPSLVKEKFFPNPYNWKLEPAKSERIFFASKYLYYLKYPLKYKVAALPSYHLCRTTP